MVNSQSSEPGQGLDMGRYRTVAWNGRAMVFGGSSDGVEVTGRWVAEIERGQRRLVIRSVVVTD